MALEIEDVSTAEQAVAEPSPSTEAADEGPISQPEAQYRLLYTVVVAGKSAEFARAAMQRFFAKSEGAWPYDWIKLLDSLGQLEAEMKSARMGCYSRLTRSFREIATAGIDLMTASPEDLEKCHGIGPKSSRFAIMWVRPQERVAALDTHVLKWLRFLGHKAPKSTPSGAEYARLEGIFIEEADRRSLNPRMLDAMIWEHASRSPAGASANDWPTWLQPEPADVPREVLEYFRSFAA